MLRNLWGAVPSTVGRTFWVSPSDSFQIDGNTYAASDNNDGLDPRRPLRTIARAWALVSANVGDQIILLPGTHSPSASIAANVAGVSMLGLPFGRASHIPRTTIGAVTGDQSVNVTAADIEIGHINFVAATTVAAVDVSTAADRLHIHDCSFDLSTAAADVGTKGVAFIGGPDRCLIENCLAHTIAQGPSFDLTGADQVTLRDCQIYVSSTATLAAAILCGAGTRAVIQRCVFHDRNGVITAGVDGTGATVANGVVVTDCRFGNGVTVPIDNFDAAECMISENYKMGLGATDGGTLVTAIT